MPELPDITLYIEALERRIGGRMLQTVRLSSPFLLRSVRPALSEADGREVVGLRRMGKRIVICLSDEHFLVLHLMIAGRLRWKDAGAKIPGKFGLAAFDFAEGTLLLTEAGSKKRASLYFVRGEQGLVEHDRGGIEVLETSLSGFRETLARENHTLKRSLTDPRMFSGIGNAYSDEILHRARMSPFKQTSQLSEEETVRLFEATRAILEEWVDRLRSETGDGFPEKITAFRKEMAVHGKYREPCPDCGSPVQRIVYTGNEANYCATCQTGGRLFADRALSRLLRKDWPRTLEELENRRRST
jgi:formamidopyrimidine-DNA glycosylase